MSNDHRHVHLLRTPAPVTSLACVDDKLAAGSDDGTLRVYDLLTNKVLKAVRGLSSEVSSVAFDKDASSVWLASGDKVSRFPMDSPKLIMDPTDASISFSVGSTDSEHPDDVVNKLALNRSYKTLAFNLDSGSVGVVAIPTAQVTSSPSPILMKRKHTNISSALAFIPDRPNEMVSAGYDCTLMHYDLTQRTILSTREISPLESTGNELSLSPPFVICMALSSSGVIAAGTADGQLWVGFGGEKPPPGAKQKKRSRKWQGLDNEDQIALKLADGPIVALCFSGTQLLTCSTLLGRILQLEICSSEDVAERLKILPEKQSQSVHKVNEICMGGKKVIIAGLSQDAKGVIEIWDE